MIILPVAVMAFPITYFATFLLMSDSEHLKFYTIVYLLLGNFLCNMNSNMNLYFDTYGFCFFLGIWCIMIGISLFILFIKSTKRKGQQ